MTDLKALANEVFSNYPTEIEVIYFTSDRHPFTELHKAEGHASRLKEKTITDIYRPGISKQQIAAKRASAASQHTADQQAAFARAFPELAEGIRYNASRDKNR